MIFRKTEQKFARREGIRNSLVNVALVLNLGKFHTNLCFCFHKMAMKLNFRRLLYLFLKFHLECLFL